MAMHALNRRHFLRASGIALALPWLETMGNVANDATPPRMINICQTLGLYADAWFP